MKYETRCRIEILIDEILKGTQHYSFTRVVLKHPLYPELVSHGDDAVEVLLERLEASEGDPMLMRMIHEAAKDGPVIPEADRGRIKKMCEHYLAWGKQRREKHGKKTTHQLPGEGAAQ